MSIILFLLVLFMLPYLVGRMKKSLRTKALLHDSYHEAGHVILSLALGYGFEKVSVGKDETGERGHVAPYDNAFDKSSHIDNENVIKIALAGTVASSLRYAGNHDDEGYSDSLIIADILMNNPSLANGHDKEYIRQARQEVRNILLANQDSLDAIASLLAERKSLVEKDVQDMMKSKKLVLVS